MSWSEQLSIRADEAGGATFSPDGVHRYYLWRQVGAGPRAVLFIGLNPSTATESVDDPTVRRCIGFARRWGFGWLRVCNLFAYRATDPILMRLAADPIGPDNDTAIADAALSASLVVAAWGVGGAFLGRGEQVASMVEHRRLHHLGLTRGGFPRHPLYLRSDTWPEYWRGGSLR